MDADRYLGTLIRYIHLNPVRSELAARPEDYPWSSYRAYAGISVPPPWLEKGTDLFSAKENKSVPFSCPRHGNIPLDTILTTVANHLHVIQETLLDKGHKRNHARDTALYLATHLSGLPLHMVGRAFGGIKPSAVAMRCRAVRDRLDDDAAFRSDLEILTANLRNKQ